MPRSTDPGREPVDYEQMFADAGALDDEPSSGDLPTVEANIGQPREDDEPEAEELAPREDLAQPEEIEEEPAPALTADEEAEQERQRILSANNELLRAQRDFERRFGRPLIDPKEMERRQQIAAAGKEIRAETPALADGVQAIVNEAVNEAVAQTQEALAFETEESRALIHDAAVTAMAPSYPDYVANPTPLIEWINELPSWAAEVYKDVFDQGQPDEVAGLIADFEAYPDPKEAAMALEQQRSGGSPAEEQDEEPAGPQARKHSTRGTRAPVAALEVRSRGSAPLPTASSAPVSDEFDAAYKEWGLIEEREQRQARG